MSTNSIDAQGLDYTVLISEWTDKAKELGHKAGENAAGWYEQDSWGGRVTRGEKENAQAFLDGWENGDPMVMDLFTPPNLSGEWAQDHTPKSLFDDIVPKEIRENMDAEDICDIMQDLSDAWTFCAEESFFESLVKSAQSVVNS